MAGSVVYEVEGVRVRHSHLDPGKEIPWHRHSDIVDMFYIIRGPVTIETREPDQQIELLTGESFRAAVAQPHRVSNRTHARVEFLLIQGVGKYDFQPITPTRT